MSYAGYATPLRLELRRSRRLRTALLALYGGAALIPWLLPLSWPWCVLCSIFLAIAGVRTDAMHGWGRGSVVALCWEEGERWRLTLRDGGVRVCRLLPGSYVHPRFAVLRFVSMEEGGVAASSRTQDATTGVLRWLRRGVYRTPVCSVMLVDDGVDAEQFRRLRVRLRLEGPGLGGIAVSGPRVG